MASASGDTTLESASERVVVASGGVADGAVRASGSARSADACSCDTSAMGEMGCCSVGGKDAVVEVEASVGVDFDGHIEKLRTLPSTGERTRTSRRLESV